MNIDATHFVNNHNSFVVKYDHSGVVERLSVMNGDAADYLQVMVEVDDHRVLLAGNHYSSTLYAGNFSVFNSGAQMPGMRCSTTHHGIMRGYGTPRQMAMRYSTRLP